VVVIAPDNCGGLRQRRGVFSFRWRAATSNPSSALADLQERKLWRSGAEAFAADEYRAYRAGLRRAKDALIEDEAKFAWFRDYDG
jgi:hypothetical protein